ncbi:MAG: VWA domain-containing protein [Planctomycetes bacterium]|nr:VWA domain-containing protein [Planctomycetota bacterium]
MKRKVNILFLILLMIVPTSATESTPCALYIILDSSWSCEHSVQDFRSLARQATISLSPEDYLELISAHTNQPKLRLAQHIKTASSVEFKEIQVALKTIKTYFLTDASISKAVEYTINRIKRSDNQNFSPKVIMVFTDSNLNNADMKRLKSLFPVLVDEGIHLYITGKNKTHREVLFAANQDTLNFALLKEANPAMFLQELRKPIILTAKEEITSYPNKQDNQITGTYGGEIKTEVNEQVIPQSPSKKITEDPSIVPTEKSTETIPQLEENKTVVFTPEPAPRTYSTRTSDDSSGFSLWKSLKSFLKSIWFYLGLLLLALLVGVVFLINYKDAKNWSKKIKSKLKKTAKKITDRVIVRIGDRVQHLGRLNQIKIIHFGSGSKNTVRIHDKSIDDRHLQLSRKKDVLWLKNLSSKTAQINGIPLQPGKTGRIPLPSIIKLSDSVTIKIELQKKPTITPQSKEDNNGQEK